MKTSLTSCTTWKTCVGPVLMLLTIPAAVGVCRGAEKEWSGSVTAGYLTDYVWRGQKLAEDVIHASVVGTLADQLTIGVLGKYGLERGVTGKFNETDLISTYTFSPHKLYRVTVGGTLYRVDDLEDPVTFKKFRYYFESSASIELRTKFSPMITFWREFGRLSTNYVELSLNPSFQIDKSWRVSVRPHLGLFEPSMRYFGADIAAYYEMGDGVYARVIVSLIKNNYPEDTHERASFGVSTGKRW